MKVAIETLHEEPTRLQEEINPQSWDMDSFDVKFVETISLTADFTRKEKHILVELEVTTRRMILCSRCLDKVKQTVRQHFRFCYNRTSLKDFLDMDNAIREEILLHFPMKLLCKPDCRGLCPECRRNLNHHDCTCSADNQPLLPQRAEGNDAYYQVIKSEYVGDEK